MEKHEFFINFWKQKINGCSKNHNEYIDLSMTFFKKVIRPQLDHCSTMYLFRGWLGNIVRFGFNQKSQQKSRGSNTKALIDFIQKTEKGIEPMSTKVSLFSLY